MAVGKQGNGGTSRYSRVGMGQQAPAKASWEDAEAEALWRTVCAITDAGDAVTLGRTRDGGAVALTILSGDERMRHYAHGEDEIATLLRSIRESLEATD